MSGWVREHLSEIVVVIGISQLGLGLWMAVAPGSFFDTLGGFGTENIHYIRDVSTMYLGLGIAMVAAAHRPGWRSGLLLFAALQYALHAVNHLVDVGEAHPGWAGPLDFALVGGTAVLFALLFAVSRNEVA